MLYERGLKRTLVIGVILDVLTVGVISMFFADDWKQWLLWTAALYLASVVVQLIFSFMSVVRRCLWFAFFGGRTVWVSEWKDYFAANGLPKFREYGEDGEGYLTRITTDSSFSTEVRMAAATRLAILNTARAQFRFTDTMLEILVIDQAVMEYAEVEAISPGEMFD
jgi:hypothetical protein